MKVYVDANDIGTTVTYKEENGKKEYIYCHDREGFVFKDLSDYTKQVRKEVCEEIKQEVEKVIFAKDLNLFGYKTLCKILDQIQGQSKDS